jgi:hypothetical protein
MLARHRSPEEFAERVPAVIRSLFVAAMTLLSLKTILVTIARNIALQDPTRARRFYLVDQVTGGLIFSVVLLVLAFLYRVPAFLPTSSPRRLPTYAIGVRRSPPNSSCGRSQV